jgi:hypothetical protein
VQRNDLWVSVLFRQAVGMLDAFLGFDGQFVRAKRHGGSSSRWLLIDSQVLAINVPNVGGTTYLVLSRMVNGFIHFGNTT